MYNVVSLRFTGLCDINHNNLLYCFKLKCIIFCVVCPGAIAVTVRPITSTRSNNNTNVAIVEGNDFNITCTVTGAERDTTTVYWTYTDSNDVVITYNATADFNISTCTFTSNLSVPHFSYDDSGTYKCVVNDTTQPNTSQGNITANVFYSGKPMIHVRTECR